MFQDHKFRLCCRRPKSLAETQNRKDVPTMPSGMDGMDYKAKTESLFMICRHVRREESFLPKLRG